MLIINTQNLRLNKKKNMLDFNDSTQKCYLTKYTSLATDTESKVRSNLLISQKMSQNNLGILQKWVNESSNGCNNNRKNVASRIIECEDNGLLHLTLTGLRLEKLPPYLPQNITTLDISEMGLESLDDLSKLTPCLKWLIVSHNNLKTAPRVENLPLTLNLLDLSYNSQLVLREGESLEAYKLSLQQGTKLERLFTAGILLEQSSIENITKKQKTGLLSKMHGHVAVVSAFITRCLTNQKLATGYLPNNRAGEFNDEYIRASDAFEHLFVRIETVVDASSLEHLKELGWQGKFIVTSDGKLRIGTFKQKEGANLKTLSHPSLSSMENNQPLPVVSAGYIGRKENGNTYITHMSGHFLPNKKSLNYASKILFALGVPHQQVSAFGFKHFKLIHQKVFPPLN
ncbi:hypothetical protein [Candidatus Regiella endosymbiont of Tuberolachnus salignus]|uniref:hypothetical protein n=1 Tax=Candidatus Regiella endosymbiont of Tuberolachnus salignus TaxID=3077956 RepID=UPI0030CB2B87